MRYSTFIFDFDYTLADATNGIVTSVNYALQQMGLRTYDKEEIRRTIGLSLPDILSRLTGITDAAKAVQFSELFAKKADEIMTANAELLPHTIDTLTFLKSRGIRTVIVSTKFRYRIIQILDKFGIGHLVDFIVGGEDVKRHKPDPDGLLLAMDHFMMQKRDVVYIGDTVTDAQAASGAGVDFLGVTTGTTERADFAPYPHKMILKDLSELVSLCSSDARWSFEIA